MTANNLESRVRDFIASLAHTEKKFSHTEYINHPGTTVIAYCASYDITDAWTETIEHYEDVVVENARSINDFLTDARATPDEANGALLRGMLYANTERGMNDLDLARARVFRSEMQQYIREQRFALIAIIPEITRNAHEQRALLYDCKPATDVPPELHHAIQTVLAQTEPSYDALYAETMRNASLDTIAQTELALYGNALRAKISPLVRRTLQNGELNKAYADFTKILESRASEKHSPLVHSILQESARVINQEYITVVLEQAAAQEKPEYFLRNLLADGKQRTGKDAPQISLPQRPAHQEPPVSAYKRASIACFTSLAALPLLAYGAYKFIPTMSKELVGGLIAGSLAASYIAGCALDCAANRKDAQFKKTQETAQAQYDRECRAQMPSFLEKSLAPYLREAFSHPHPIHTTYVAQPEAP